MARSKREGGRPRGPGGRGAGPAQAGTRRAGRERFDARPERREREPREPIARAARPEAIVEALPRRDGALPAMRAPVILTTAPGEDYALVDSGHGRKLERYGGVLAIRPEAQALWPPLRPDAWRDATAVFTGETDEGADDESKGRWAFPREPLGEVWPMRHDGLDYWGRFTAFRHMGVFPEQAAHWRWMEERLRARPAGARVLNLFGYTGLASLVAARAGAEVTHVDASRKAIGWARENAVRAGLEDAPIRWICEDAAKFVAREGRRGRAYDLVLLDPPKFGRGPGGEVWQLFEHLPALLADCRDILAPRGAGMVLTAYAVRASFYALHGLMGETMRGMGGTVESGELLIEEEAEDGPGRLLPTSLFSRWTAGNAS